MCFWRDKSTKEAHFSNLRLAHIVSTYKASCVMWCNGMLHDQSAQERQQRYIGIPTACARPLGDKQEQHALLRARYVVDEEAAV